MRIRGLCSLRVSRNPFFCFPAISVIFRPSGPDRDLSVENLKEE